MQLEDLTTTAIPVPAATTPRLPPMLCASVYCHGGVDSLMREVMVPFRKSMAADFPDASLWLLRYARRGQHLKVRLHLPAEAHPACKIRLEAAVGAYFARHEAAAERVPHPFFLQLPPIDSEDEGESPGRDRSLVFTTYEYHPGQVGSSPIYGLPGFEKLYHGSLAAASSATLAWLEAREAGGAAGDPSVKQRMGFALQMLLAGVSGLDPGPGRQTRHLAFQRDWLLRLRSDRTEVLELFDRKMSAGLPSAERPGGPAPAGEGFLLGKWSRAMADLGAFCRQEMPAGEAPAAADPFVDPLHLAASRAIHNAINPLGIGLENEAYLCHLSIGLRGTGEARPS